MNRNILLVEPNYKNKYPPMSLMKIATYYRRKGDNVRFFKGDLKDLAATDLYNELVVQLNELWGSVDWHPVRDYIRYGLKKYVPEMAYNDDIVCGLLKEYRLRFRKKEFVKCYDKILVTTLFTFFAKETIETINFVKHLSDDVRVGGIMASVVSEYIEEQTGIKPVKGTLVSARLIGEDDDTSIEEMPLDYSILDQIDYKYHYNGFIAYMTRGCVNKCAFCVVPKIEPQYKNYLPLKKNIDDLKEKFGDRQALYIMDNNVLASDRLRDIIDEIKAAGFYKGATYLPENELEHNLRMIKSAIDTKPYINNIMALTSSLKEKHKELADAVVDINKPQDLLNTFNKYLPKKRGRNRVVDFNQGLDSRLITDEKMAMLAELPIRPIRIAFDHWELKDVYEKSIRLAVKHGFEHLSNYVLYNFKDKPDDLYHRVELNAALTDEFHVEIYSFPMRYAPIDDPNYFYNRKYLGKHWKWHYIRVIQTMLIPTLGKFRFGLDTFHFIMGKDINDFHMLLYSPIGFIKNRKHEKKAEWQTVWNSLSNDKLEKAKSLIEDLNYQSEDEEIDKLLSFYREYK